MTDVNKRQLLLEDPETQTFASPPTYLYLAEKCINPITLTEP